MYYVWHLVDWQSGHWRNAFQWFEPEDLVERTGSDIHPGYCFFKQNGRRVEGILAITFFIDNIESDKTQGQQINITLCCAVVWMYLPNFMCRKLNAKGSSVRHGIFVKESRVPEGCNGCHYCWRCLLTHRSSVLSHTLSSHGTVSY